MASQKNSILALYIPQLLKTIRLEKGYTLETVYSDTDIHVARLESKKGSFTIATLLKLCDYYEISIFDFFSRLEKMDLKQVNNNQ